MSFLAPNYISRAIQYFSIGCVVVPSSVLASDFTGLFVLFVEIPILVLSILFLLLCFGAPKVGRVLCAIWLFASLIVLLWAMGGYMDSAGGFLLTSLLVDIAGIAIASNKINKAQVQESEEPLDEQNTA